MSSNLKAAVGEKEAAAIRKRLSAWAKSRNPTCADCNRTNPTWASVNLGVLVCLECAGRHRSLGTHISKMRSITLDTVLPEEAFFLVNMSNALANKYWEATLSEFERPRAIQGSHFISQKYADRRWALTDSSVPVPSKESVPHTHPWWRDGQAGAAPVPSAAKSTPASQQKPKIQLPKQVAAPKAPQPAAVASVAPVADLIDFGSFESAPESASTKQNAGNDLFGSMGASSAPEAASAPTSFDPFSCEPASGSTAAPVNSTPAVPAAQPVQDPFANMAGLAAPLSATPSLQHPQPAARHNSAPGQVGQSGAPVATQGVAMHSMSAPPAQPGFPQPLPPVAGAPMPRQQPVAAPAGMPMATTGASAAETKAQMNARILALYNSGPAPGAGAPVAGLFGGPGQQRSDPGMVPAPQFAAPASYVGPRPAR